jgi:hypothetical protein
MCRLHTHLKRILAAMLTGALDAKQLETQGVIFRTGKADYESDRNTFEMRLRR